MAVDKAKSAAGRIGAHEKWAKTLDRAAATAPARKARMERWEREVDPDGVLDPETRAEMAAHKRKAYMQRLALKSAAVRRSRARGKKAA